MAIPTGYEKLAVIGIAYKGDYTEETAYKLLNAVYYNGATYVALKDDPVTPPVADGINWQYLAKGFTDGVLSAIEAIDTSGLIGQAGATVGAQLLLDVIADKVATKLLAKNQVVNNLLATIPGNALDACQGKALMDLINQQNSDYAVTGSKTVLATAYNDKQVFTAPVAGVFEVLVSSFKDVYGCLHFTQSNGLTYKLLGSNNSGVGLSMHIPANAGDTITAQTSSASTNANAIEVSFIALK